MNFTIEEPTVETAAAAAPLVCLNMIVKNESRIIRRMLSSVVKFIDCYCICDTGSTDNTIEIITEFFQQCVPPIPGKITREPFRDFGYNRSVALTAACNAWNVKYILLMDADMVLELPDPTAVRNELSADTAADAYCVFQGSPVYYYKNVRILKNNPQYYYWGTTHEYIKTPPGTRYKTMDRSEIFINDVGDGGSKSNKCQRDIDLLTQGLKENPDNDRYTFYLANSHRDAGHYETAIDLYKKRIALGGWVEEVWMSHYYIGDCYKRMGDMILAVHWWMEAYQYYPRRIENLYEIIKHYRIVGKQKLATAFYEIADQERQAAANGGGATADDHLFLQKDIYDYKLDYELSIIGYYHNPQNRDLTKCCMKVLNSPNTESHDNVLSNYKFYVKKWVEYATEATTGAAACPRLGVLKTIGGTLHEINENRDTFSSSTPSVLIRRNNNSLVVNVRFVDYYITPSGNYANREKIRTKNVVANVDMAAAAAGGWKITQECLLQYDESHDGRYVGLEDIRLFSADADAPDPNKDIKYCCNRGVANDKIVVEHGGIEVGGATATTAASVFLSIENQRDVEKNWVMFSSPKNETQIIYGWYPLVIGTADATGKFHKQHEIKTPPFFRHLRGSTNGVFMKATNEIWFITHCVSFEDRRYYYHCFVALDADTYSVVRYSPLFSFEKEKVEYTLGFGVLEETRELLIGYSVMDNRSEYITVPIGVVDAEMTERPLPNV